MKNVRCFGHLKIEFWIFVFIQTEIISNIGYIVKMEKKSYIILSIYCVQDKKKKQKRYSKLANLLNLKR